MLVLREPVERIADVRRPQMLAAVPKYLQEQYLAKGSLTVAQIVFEACEESAKTGAARAACEPPH